LYGALVGLFDRRFLLTSWLPGLLFWAGLLGLAAAGPGWADLLHWWTGQPAEVRLLLAALGLAWTTFTAALLAANLGAVIRLGEGYWETVPVLRRLETTTARPSPHPAPRAEQGPGRLSPALRQLPGPSQQRPATRLGNILKSAEDYPADRYEINAVVAWPRLYLVLPDRMRTTLAGAKASLDLMATPCALGGSPPLTDATLGRGHTGRPGRGDRPFAAGDADPKGK
jgi:hypothetical protein